MSTKKRNLFALIWSIVSVLGILIRLFYVPAHTGTAILLYYLTGFHVPQDAVYYFSLFGLFTDHPEIGGVFLLLGAAFLVLWIVSLVRLKHSHIFEYLILSDRIISFLLCIGVMILLQNEFAGWYLPVIHTLDVIITFVLFVILKKQTHSEHISLTTETDLQEKSNSL